YFIVIFNTANVNVSNIGIHGTQTTQTNADILIINKINLRLSAYSASSASGNVNSTHPPMRQTDVSGYDYRTNASR
ncbi:hypothetical protein PQG89_10625, partial [Parabacteroides johnsonii]|nr:hypothetical protein [Parabacteroides johnsonii]